MRPIRHSTASPFVAAAVAALLAAGPALAQTSASSGAAPLGAQGAATARGTGPSHDTVRDLGASGAAPAARTGAPAHAAKLDRSDSRLLADLARGNMAEVDAGKLALEKSQSPDVKKFAQQMVDDHGKALGEIQALAAAKNVQLPEGPGVGAKTKATALKALSGDLFDKEYAKHAGVGDHESTVKLLKKIQKEGKDGDLKALAGKMLPTVQAHLGMAKELAAKEG